MGCNSTQCTSPALRRPASPKGQLRIFCTSDAMVEGPRVYRNRVGSHPPAILRFVAVMLLCFACGSPKKQRGDRNEGDAGTKAEKNRTEIN